MGKPNCGSREPYYSTNGCIIATCLYPASHRGKICASLAAQPAREGHEHVASVRLIYSLGNGFHMLGCTITVPTG